MAECPRPAADPHPPAPARGGPAGGEAAAPVPPPPRGARSRDALLLALGTASALGLARFGYGLLLPAMRADLHWSLAGAGAMTTANGAGYLAGAALAGPLGRRWTAPALFRTGMVLVAVTLAVTAVSGAFAVQVAARAGAGVSGALVFVAGGVIASRRAEAARSAVPVLLYFAGAGLGIAVCGVTLPALLDGAAHRWPLGWLCLAVLAAGCTAAAWRAARADAPGAGAAAGRRVVRPLWRTAVAYGLFATGYIAYLTFLSATLADRQVPVGQVAALWTLLGAGAMAAPWVWHRPMAAWPTARTLTVLLAVLAGASALALPGAPPGALAVSVLLYGGCFMAVPAAVAALIRDRTRPGDWLPTLAAFTVVFGFGQTAGPWAAGAVADAAGADAPLIWTTALCGAAAVLAATDRPALDTS